MAGKYYADKVDFHTTPRWNEDETRRRLTKISRNGRKRPRWRELVESFGLNTQVSSDGLAQRAGKPASGIIESPKGMLPVSCLRQLLPPAPFPVFGTLLNQPR